MLVAKTLAVPKPKMRYGKAFSPELLSNGLIKYVQTAMNTIPVPENVM